MADEPELSSELEWMLGSGQANPAILAEALIENFYRPAYRLCLALLEDFEAAAAAVQAALVAAVSNAPHYQQMNSPQTWFFRQVLETVRKARRPARSNPGSASAPASAWQPPLDLWRVLEALEEDVHLPTLFGCLLGWQVDEIALVLGKRPGEVSAALDRGRRKLARALPPDQEPAAALQAALPGLALSRDEIRKKAAVTARQVDRQGQRQSRIIHLRELLWLSAAVLLTLGLAWGSQQQAQAPTTTPPPLNTPVPSLTPTPEVTLLYFARPGDTLVSIAGPSGPPLADLVRLNTLPAGKSLPGGQP